MHPWHNVDLGKNFPKELNAIIEIPKDSSVQYHLDDETGLLRLSEVLPGVTHYPANYGFFPRTLSTDGAALDVFVLSHASLHPLTLLTVRPIGGAKTVSSRKGVENKLIGVAVDDPEFAIYRNIDELPEFYLTQLRQFLLQYKAVKGDKKKVKSFFSKAEAQKIIRDCAEKYDKKFAK